MAGCSQRLGCAGMPRLTVPIAAAGRRGAAPAEGGRIRSAGSVSVWRAQAFGELVRRSAPNNAIWPGSARPTREPRHLVPGLDGVQTDPVWAGRDPSPPPPCWTFPPAGSATTGSSTSATRARPSSAKPWRSASGCVPRPASTPSSLRSAAPQQPGRPDPPAQSPGCCRCVTRPPATTVARSGAVASASAGRTPRSAATGNGTGLVIVEAGTSRPAGWLDSTFASHRSS